MVLVLVLGENGIQSEDPTIVLACVQYLTLLFWSCRVLGHDNAVLDGVLQLLLWHVRNDNDQIR